MTMNKLAAPHSEEIIGDDFIPVDSGFDEKYPVFSDPQLNKIMYLSLGNTHYKIAFLVHYVYKNIFAYTKSNGWYIFVNHRWRKDNETLLVLISNEIPKLYAKMMEVHTNVMVVDDEKIYIDAINKVLPNLHNYSFQRNVLKESGWLFLNDNPNFETKLDKKNHLICFENGVYDLNTFSFRDGSFDDYLSMSVGYDYVAEHTPHKNDLLNFLRGIFPDDAKREYTLTYISTGLSGKIREEIFIILIGAHMSGKTKLKELISCTLGDYFLAFDSTLLTSQRHIRQQELINFKGKRFVIPSDFNTGSNKIQTDFLNFIIGRDKITWYGHCSPEITIRPTHRIMIMCNSIYEIENIDTIKRTKNIKLPSIFVDNPNRPNERLVDYSIGSKLCLWKQDFMLLLIEYYKDYI